MTCPKCGSSRIRSERITTQTNSETQALRTKYECDDCWWSWDEQGDVYIATMKIALWEYMEESGLLDKLAGEAVRKQREDKYALLRNYRNSVYHRYWSQ